ncbi:MAG: hypothetical protein FWF92_06520 [Oscillospiraceae bacterium]|nr:hypothetical protein [Oscillospiraceae bacterium]
MTKKNSANIIEGNGFYASKPYLLKEEQDESIRLMAEELRKRGIISVSNEKTNQHTKKSKQKKIFKADDYANFTDKELLGIAKKMGFVEGKGFYAIDSNSEKSYGIEPYEREKETFFLRKAIQILNSHENGKKNIINGKNNPRVPKIKKQRV